MFVKKNETVVISGRGNTRKTGIAVLSMLASVMALPYANEGPLNQIVIVSNDISSSDMINYVSVLGGFASVADLEAAFSKRNCAISAYSSATLEIRPIIENLEGFVESQAGGLLDVLIDEIGSYVDFNKELQIRLKKIGKDINGNLYITIHAASPFNFDKPETGRMAWARVVDSRLLELTDVVLVTPTKSEEITAKIYDHKLISEIGREFTFKASGISENNDALKELNAKGYGWVAGPLAN